MCRCLVANLPPAATLQSILSQFRSRMQDKGIDAYWNLRTHLMSLEKQLTVATGKLDRIDLRNALLQWDEADKMGLQARHFDAVLDEVDRQRLGLIDIQVPCVSCADCFMNSSTTCLLLYALYGAISCMSR